MGRTLSAHMPLFCAIVALAGCDTSSDGDDSGTADGSTADSGASDSGKDGAADGGCDYGGQHYETGAMFSSTDGCNTCSCGADGLVACTLLACVDGGPDAAGLSWYQTCGAPVCGPGTDTPTGQPLCTTETVGDACSDAGALCDPGLGCSVNLICADSDPTMAPGGCPISRARYKQDIQYVGAEQRAQIAEELLSMPLASWQYVHDPRGTPHLGFIIDDVEPSPGARGDHVDLYGYLSMAVATLQSQAEQMRVLEREVLQMRQHVLQLEAGGTRTGAACGE